MGNSESQMPKSSERECSGHNNEASTGIGAGNVQNKGVPSMPPSLVHAGSGSSSGTVTRTSILQQQQSYTQYRRPSGTQPQSRPSMGEIRLSDTRTPAPAATTASTAPSTTRRPSGAHLQATRLPSWQRTSPAQPPTPSVAVTVTEASRTPSEGSDAVPSAGTRGNSSSRSKWHGHPAVDVVRLVAAGMSRVRSKDSSKSAKGETKPLLSQASPQTPIQPQLPAVQVTNVSPNSSAPIMLSEAALGPTPVAEVSQEAGKATQVKGETSQSAKQLWKPVVDQLDEKASLSEAEANATTKSEEGLLSKTEEPEAQAVVMPSPIEVAAASTAPEVEITDAEAPDASLSVPLPLSPVESNPTFTMSSPIESHVHFSNEVMPIPTAPTSESTTSAEDAVLAAPTAPSVDLPAATSRQTSAPRSFEVEDTFYGQNTEDTQAPHTFPPGPTSSEPPIPGLPSRPTMPARLSTLRFEPRPFFDDPFSGEILPSPWANQREDSASESSSRTRSNSGSVATPSSPLLPPHTRDTTLVAGEDEGASGDEHGGLGVSSPVADRISFMDKASVVDLIIPTPKSAVREMPFFVDGSDRPTSAPPSNPIIEVNVEDDVVPASPAQEVHSMPLPPSIDVTAPHAASTRDLLFDSVSAPGATIFIGGTGAADIDMAPSRTSSRLCLPLPPLRVPSQTTSSNPSSSLSANRFDLRNVQKHSPLPDSIGNIQLRAGTLHMTPVRNRSPVEEYVSTSDVQLDVFARKDDDQVPMVNTFEFDELAMARANQAKSEAIADLALYHYTPAGPVLKGGVYQLRNIKVSLSHKGGCFNQPLTFIIVQTGEALDLSAGDHQTVCTWSIHGGINQQVGILDLASESSNID
jgi:hypothetical protein